MVLCCLVSDVFRGVDSKSLLRKKKIRKPSKNKLSGLAQLRALVNSVPMRTPVRRVYRKRTKGVEASPITPPNIDEIIEPESPLPFQSANLSDIRSSPANMKLRPPVFEETPKSSGIPQKNPMDSISNKMLQMNLASTVPRDLSRVSASFMVQEDGKSVHHEPLHTVEPSHLQSEASSVFLGFSPSLDYVTRRRPRRIPMDDSGSGDFAENITKEHLPTRDAASGSVEIPSPEAYRSDIDSGSESLLSRSSRRGSGALPEDVAKRRQTLRTMDPAKRDSGDIASPESSHSGVDSSNESALEEVGVSHPKRLSGLKEGSSSGTIICFSFFSQFISHSNLFLLSGGSFCFSYQ